MFPVCFIDTVLDWPPPIENIFDYASIEIFLRELLIKMLKHCENFYLIAGEICEIDKITKEEDIWSMESICIFRETMFLGMEGGGGGDKK